MTSAAPPAFLARLCLSLGILTLLLPPAWAWWTADPTRREWALSVPLLSGMGGGPNQLWALVACVLAGAAWLGLGAWLLRRGHG